MGGLMSIALFTRVKELEEKIAAIEKRLLNALAKIEDVKKPGRPKKDQ